MFICCCLLWNISDKYDLSDSMPLKLIISSFKYTTASCPSSALDFNEDWLTSHLVAVQSVCQEAPSVEWDLWCHRSHYQSWWLGSPPWATPLGLPVYTKRFDAADSQTDKTAQWKQVLTLQILQVSAKNECMCITWVLEVGKGKPHLTVGCCEGESTHSRPWCPRSSLCSTPLLSDPGPGG